MSVPCLIPNAIKWSINLRYTAPVYFSDFIPYHPPTFSLSSRHHDLGSNFWTNQGVFYPKTFALTIPSALTILSSKSSQTGFFSLFRCQLKYHHFGKAFLTTLSEAASFPRHSLIHLFSSWYSSLYEVIYLFTGYIFVSSH